MSALRSVAAGVGWKIAAVALGITLIAVCAGGGTAYAFTARDLEQAQRDAAQLRTDNEDLRTSIREQNRATEALGRVQKAAAAAAAAARAKAVANGARYDRALASMTQRTEGSSCADVMPMVNSLLKEVQ